MINYKIYEALKNHVTGLFRNYGEFVPGIPFRTVTETDAILTAEVVEYNEGVSSYGEYAPSYIIFKVGTKFYKLEGYKASYGGLEWDNYVAEVSRTENVVYLYE